MKNNKIISFKTNIFYYSYLFILFYLSNARSMVFGWIALLSIVIWAMVSNEIYCINVILFLIPCIRILDSLGQSFYVNIAIVFLGIKILYVACVNNNQISKALLLTIIIFLVEFLHVAINDLSISTEFINSFNIAFNFLLCVSIILCQKAETEKKHYSYSLLIGVSVSSAVSLLVNPYMLSSILHSFYRFDAYGNDPNYLSMYIILGIAGILTHFFKSQIKTVDYFLILISCLWGLMTSSKMFILCIVSLFGIFIFFLIDRGKIKTLISFAAVSAVLVIIVVAWQKNNITYLIKKVLDRIFTANSLHDITTGRSDILIRYFEALRKDFISLFFGRGISYARYFNNTHGIAFIAHNTYMDVILSWGIIGGILFFIAFFAGLKKYYHFQKKLSYYLPLLLFFVMLFALSCFSSDMFWYMLAYCLIYSGTGIKERGRGVLKNENFDNCRNVLS